MVFRNMRSMPPLELLQLLSGPRLQVAIPPIYQLTALQPQTTERYARTDRTAAHAFTAAGLSTLLYDLNFHLDVMSREFSKQFHRCEVCHDRHSQ